MILGVKWDTNFYKLYDQNSKNCFYLACFYEKLIVVFKKKKIPKDLNPFEWRYENVGIEYRNCWRWRQNGSDDP